MTSITIIKAGFLTTIQDLGRTGYRRFGINPGGAMDHRAARIVNGLAGNDENPPVLEMHFPAAEIGFGGDLMFALGGADFQATLDGVPIDNWRCHIARSGSILRFEGKASGERAYIAVNAGFIADTWLGSSSTNLVAGIGGVAGRPLRNGDVLRSPESDGSLDQNALRQIAATSLIPFYSRFPTLRIIKGAEYGILSQAGKAALTEQTFELSHASDRMGFRLKAEPLATTRPLEMVSSSVTYGTIQLLPDGQLVILMADHQTAGGYPRIAHIIAHDLPVAAQLGGGAKLCFHLVGIEEAESLRQQIEHELSLFRIGCRLRRRV